MLDSHRDGDHRGPHVLEYLVQRDSQQMNLSSFRRDFRPPAIENYIVRTNGRLPPVSPLGGRSPRGRPGTSPSTLGGSRSVGIPSMQSVDGPAFVEYAKALGKWHMEAQQHRTSERPIWKGPVWGASRSQRAMETTMSSAEEEVVWSAPDSPRAVGGAEKERSSTHKG